MTPGSWWINKRTGQRLAVKKHATSFMSQHSRREGRRWVRRGEGRNEDRLPCCVEGLELYLVWLTHDELLGGWKPYRPKKDTGRIPRWLSHPPQFNDFLYTPPLHVGSPHWVTVVGIRSGWLCLSGIVEDESTLVTVKATSNLGFAQAQVRGNFDWGLQKYNTFFLPASEVVSRLVPKYDKIRKTVAERLIEGLDED